ncbi:MAG: homocysteine S-methyltransferase family protein [Armatimonadota bacterium]|nr:MAG: homocysteine S-methyltransferase family protein [Armatimonadota bacterium]
MTEASESELTEQSKTERFLARLNQGLLIGDGAMGTMLEAAGLPAGACRELWNVEQPDQVAAVHRAYIEAGSDIIETNTFFGGNRVQLRKWGLEERVVEFNQAAVRLARAAAGDRVIVSVSMGPTGEVLAPLGNLDPEQAAEAFREQAAAAAEAGADAATVETFYALEEIKLAVETAVAAGLPVMATMTFEPSGRTMMGVAPADAARALTDYGATVIGANCGTGPDAMLAVVEAMLAATDRPVMVQPNAGMSRLVGGKTVFPETPESMAEYAERFAEMGVKIIGGCCGTGVRIIGGCCGSTPDHIRAIAQRLKSRESSPVQGEN